MQQYVKVDDLTLEEALDLLARTIRRELTPATPSIKNEWLSIQEAADVTGTSYQTMYRAVKSGAIPGEHIAGTRIWRIHQSALQPSLTANEGE